MSLLSDDIFENVDKTVQDHRKIFTYYEIYSFICYGSKSVFSRCFYERRTKEAVEGKEHMQIRENRIMLYNDPQCPEICTNFATLIGQCDIGDLINNTNISNNIREYQGKDSIKEISGKISNWCLRHYKDVCIRISYTDIQCLTTTQGLLLPLFLIISVKNGKGNMVEYHMVLKPHYKNLLGIPD